MHILEAIVFGIPMICGNCGKEVPKTNRMGLCGHCAYVYKKQHQRKKKG